MTRHPRWRLISGGVMVLSSVLVSSVLASPARADLLDPGTLDPVVEILPPRPAPYVPYTGDICPSGANRCIDKTITEMRRRLEPLADSCQHDAVFSLAYLRVTEDVRRAIHEGVFADRVWMNQVDAVFARMYFDTIDDWHAGRRGAVPAAWAIALQAEDDHAMSGIGNFMLAMNAHINRDFPNVIAEVGLSGPDGSSHKPDHNAYNPRLDALYAPVFAEMAARFDPTFDDLDLGPFDEAFVGGVMRGWREAVWRHAENIALARNPIERALARQQVEAYAASQAALIRTIFASPDPSARDAWCAEHHG